MRRIIIILILLFSNQVSGQNNYIGIQGGVSWTNANSLNTSPNLADNNFKNGFMGGLTYEYHFKNNFYFGLDFLYAQKGFIEDPIYGNETDSTLNHVYIYKYNYFSFPIKVGYSLGYKFQGFLNLGFVPSFLNKAEIIVPHPGEEKEPFTATQNVSNLDLAAVAEIGGRYKFRERFLLFSSLSYQRSFFPTINYPIYQSIMHYSLTLSVGIKYGLTAN